MSKFRSSQFQTGLAVAQFLSVLPALAMSIITKVSAAFDDGQLTEMEACKLGAGIASDLPDLKIKVRGEDVFSGKVQKDLGGVLGSFSWSLVGALRGKDVDGDGV